MKSVIKVFEKIDHVGVGVLQNIYAVSLTYISTFMLIWVCVHYSRFTKSGLNKSSNFVYITVVLDNLVLMQKLLVLELEYQSLQKESVSILFEIIESSNS